MKQKMMPEFIFSEWKSLDSLSDFKLDNPGIYIIAASPNKIRGKVKTDDKRIIYIGETCDQTLKKRLIQFKRSSSKPDTRGHSGGRTYYEKHPRSTHQLYFTTHEQRPVSKTNEKKEINDSTIRLIERFLIYQYLRKNKKLPAGNSK